MTSLGEYRKNRDLRTLCGRLLKHFISQLLSARGCEDADMCGGPDPCAIVDKLFGCKFYRTPLAMTPILFVLFPLLFLSSAPLAPILHTTS